MLPRPDDLIETFALLPDWEARYAYLIDLGRALPPMDQALKTDAVLVTGCTSRVWLVGEARKTPADINLPPQGGRDGSIVPSNIFHFTIDSDAAIVKGLCAVLMVFVQDRSAAEIRALDLEEIFSRLGLGDHLSPNRRSGFFAMVERVKALAA